MKHSKITRLCSALLAIVMVIGLMPTAVMAADAENVAIEAAKVLASSDADALGKGDAVGSTGLHVTSVRNYQIAPGISESVVITNNSKGDAQTVANVMEVNVNNGTAKLAAGYGTRDPGSDGWKMKTTTDQAHLYEKTYGENVVGGVNASLFNITTGQPMGYLVMKGVEYTGGSELAYVGIFDDNSVGLFTPGTSLEQAAQQQSQKQGKTVTLVDAISGWYILYDGQNIATEGSNGGYYSRSAIGLKADGTVVIMEADGTMPPRSLGYTVEEMGNMMKALGCVCAIELDEGGSATYVSQREGEDDVTMRNTPAGGSERVISTSILVVSTATPSGEFDHADIAPNGDYYTPNAEVTLTASAIDSSGAAAKAMPESVTWAMAEGSENMGTVTAGAVSGAEATAVFKSNGTEGAAVINMMNGGKVVGTAVINIHHPDELYFSSGEVALDYGEISDLGLVAKYKGDEVNMKSGDISWSIPSATYNGCEWRLDGESVTGAVNLAGKGTSRKYAYGIQANITGTTISWKLISEVNYSSGADEKALDVAIDASTITWTQTSDTVVTGSFVYDYGTGVDTVNFTVDSDALQGTVQSDGSIQWKIATPNVGTFEGLAYHATKDKSSSLAANVRAVYATDEKLTATVVVNVGMAPAVVMDGGDTDVWDYSTIGNTVESFAGMASDQVATYHYAGRGGVVKGSVVSDADEEYADIVRFGSKAIKLEYDWTGITGTDGACLGLGGALLVNGSPTAIGIWVYIPEGVAVPWLRVQIATSSDGANWTNAYINFTDGDHNANNLVEGWQYLEADLTPYAGVQIRVNSGMLFRAMVTPDGIGWYTVDHQKLDQSQLKGYIIVDNIQFVYGSNNQDITLPTIENMQLINDDGTKSVLENGGTYDRNNFNFFVSYNDNEDTDEFATGIESAYFYLDGVYYGEGSKDNLGSTLAGVQLANGQHSLTFYLKDGFGNVTRETRYFTVAGSTAGTGVALNVSGEPTVGKPWVLSLDTNNMADMKTMDATLSLSRGYQVTEVKFPEGVTGTYSFNESKGNLDIQITDVAEGVTGTTLATVSVEIPASTKQGAAISLAVTRGIYTTASGEYYKGFTTASKTYDVEAAYVVSAPIMVAGLSTEITVVDADGKAASGVTVYYGEGTEIGKTDENGKVDGSVLTESAASNTIYAMDDQGNLSYPVEVTSYTATGDETGAPYYILNQVAKDPATMQNITWMSNPLKSAETAQAKISTKEDMSDAVAVNGTSNVVFYSKSGTATRANAVVFTGLTAETTYYYQVGDGTVWSDVKSFTTSEADMEETNIFMMADIQEEDALTGMGRITEALGASGVDYDLGIQTGDAVDNVRYYNQWEDALGLFSLDGIKDYDMIHVVGNHEDDDDGYDAYAAKSVFNLAGDWYSVKYGEVYVAVMNHVTSKDGLAAFGEWLKEDAAASDCNWKIVVGHVPVYTTNPGGKNDNYCTMLPGIFQEAGIDFYFAGDAHSYARTKPMVDQTVNDDGVVYYICGSTGGKSYSCVDDPDYNFAVATLDFESVYMTISADQDEITVNAYNVETDGSVTLFDTYSKEKVRCENDGHTYTYYAENDTLICDDCGYKCKAAKEMYAGWATEAVSGGAMYFVGGKYATGDVKMEDNSVAYFNEQGIALQGEVDILGETCVFEKGVYVSSKNEDVEIAGYCGTNLQWIFYKNGTFKIDGEGAMRDFAVRGAMPWATVKENIKRLEIGAGITNIGIYAFSYSIRCKEIVFAEGSKLTAVNGCGFHYMYSLKTVTLPETVTYLGNYAFGYCFALTDVYLPAGLNSIYDTAFNYCDMNADDKKPLHLSVAAGSYAEEYAVAKGLKYDVRDENGENAHAWDEGKVTTEATCTKAGETTYVCKTCGEIKTEEIAALGHAWDEGKVTTEATCTKAGVKTYTCKTCGETKTEEIAALGHAWDDGKVTTEATCTEKGVKTYTCKTCGETKTEEIAALGHDWDDGEVTKAPTYTEKGERTFTCKTCGETKTAEIPALGTGEYVNPFKDVEEGRFFYNSVAWAVENDITNGMSENTFEPKTECTRGHVITFLWRAAGCPEPESDEHPFTDLDETRFYYKAVLWGVEQGIVEGMTATTFEPWTICSRSQVATFLYRFAGEPDLETDETKFTDLDANRFYYNAVLWADANNIANGMTDDTFEPKTECTRGHVVTFLYRLMVENG